ncbi:MAG: aconitate hydratase [Chlorobi bacterium]|nr:aconitate hydratase [Chlorobiota bacterium]
MAFDIKMIRTFYQMLNKKLSTIRKTVDKPLTLAEKILYTHLDNTGISGHFSRGKDYVDFRPDRVAMQDATAQMALLQFMMAGKNKVAVPSTVHCDHLITAKKGAGEDLETARYTNQEVYDFLASVSNKYGIGFWKPGAGIIHQVVLENYAFPGGMMIGTDSHTPNAGGLGMIAIGVGGADAVDVMADMPWELKFPKVIGIKLTGKLTGWAAPKDVILKVADILTVKGGTGYILEYFGAGVRSLSATGRATICNMGAEVGATTSTFGFDENTAEYLRQTGRNDVAELAGAVKEHLTGDPEVYNNPEKYFDKVIEINLSELEPALNGPFTPDLRTTTGKMAETAVKNDWPLNLEAGLIGSCTNSSYEDITRAASIARQAIEKNLKPKAKLYITPGSEQIRYTMERDGLIKVFEKIGGVVLANACGPCIGQWDREDVKDGHRNSIVTSFNRNFAKRNDGNPHTYAFVTSPEMVMTYAIAGRLDFDPLHDTLENENGEQVHFDEPSGIVYPPKGFEVGDPGYLAPAEDGNSVNIVVKPDSERLQLLTPFPVWDGNDYHELHLLIKAKGKCTTDHISMAGPWLRYRGHLENISQNLLIGAVNYFNEKTNSVKNQLTGKYMPVPDAAKAYRDAGKGSIIIGDENYGEGSSREHAAMEPRFMGVQAVLVRSFARIHETNLKKQGMLAITFDNPADYDKVQEEDTFDILGLGVFAPGKQLTVIIRHKDGSNDSVKVNHSYNENQIEWFRAGSALNLIRQQNNA